MNATLLPTELPRRLARIAIFSLNLKSDSYSESILTKNIFCFRQSRKIRLVADFSVFCSGGRNFLRTAAHGRFATSLAVQFLTQSAQALRSSRRTYKRAGTKPVFCIFVAGVGIAPTTLRLCIPLQLSLRQSIDNRWTPL